MAAIYRVKDWDIYFENNRTRELKEMSWVPVPNRMDGDGYTELVGHPDGAAHLGAWLAIIEIASRCGTRGTLLRDGLKPHDSKSLARISRLPEEIFKAVIPRLLQIGWLEEITELTPPDHTVTDTPQEGATIPQEGAVMSQESAPSRARVERNGTEGKGKKVEPKKQVQLRVAPACADDDTGESRTGVSASSSLALDPVFLVFPCVGGKTSKENQWALTEFHLAELADTFPSVDVRQVARELWQWTKDNPSRRKTHTGMRDFLSRNMAKRQNGGYTRDGPNGQRTKETRGGNPRPIGSGKLTRSERIEHTLANRDYDQLFGAG